MRLCRTALAAILLLCAFPTFAQSARVQDALAYLSQEAPQFGLSAADIADVAVTDAYVSRRSGATHVYLRQRVGGVEVVGSEMTLNVASDGRVFHVAGEPISALNSRVAEQQPSVDPLSAALRAGSILGIRIPSLRALATESGTDRSTRFSANGSSDSQVKTKLVYKADDQGAYRLAWEVELALAAQGEYWLVYVDAVSGDEVSRLNLTVFDTFVQGAEGQTLPTVPSFAPVESNDFAVPAMALSAMVGSYRVFQVPVESPNHASPPAPSDARTLHANPDDATASPFGWHDVNGVAGAEFTDTQGNNVDARKGAVRPSGGGGLVFDFPADFSMSPINYVPAATTNTFYHSNIFHDITYHYGFDEPAGNFQENNYGNGGAGSDYIFANVQASGNCNANFGTPSDGNNPTMNMYLCTTPNPDADTDFDTIVIQHEIAHGVSNRLTGGPANTGCLGNAEQMGEGWSDWYGVLTTIEPGDARADRRGVGTYSITGGSTTSNGIRPAPYSTSFAINGFTYQDTRTQVAPHGVGFVWATILWEATWDLIDAYGFNPDLYDATSSAGNTVMMNLVTTGMKLQPCNPGFVTGRDAILAADAALYGGEHTNLLWAAFARRGLGFSATQGSAFSNGDNTEAFDIPPPTVGDLTISCTPDDPTTSIPVGGGNYFYDIVVTNNTASAQSFDLWITVVGPSGGIARGPYTRSLAAGPGTTFVRNNVRQRVPAGASAGDYKHNCFVGTFSTSTVIDSDQFSFSKLTTFAPGDETVLDWSSDAEIGADLAQGNTEALGASASAAGLPASVELTGAYPNPFNPTSTITYALAQRGPVELSVFNTLGQRVAVLAAGVQEAGSHSVQFDASSLPSGVYVYTLNADGQVLTGRLMLVK